ncbi:kinetochore Sim4 complex subunit Fta2 [Xylariaceae sp. FL0804]|nr:kinetochore Sim4 complex subunit Fta2 [Xylariaceae sp. FL0804]
MTALPNIPGPKLKPFGSETGQPVEIEFIRHVGKGAHAHVWKVRLNGEVYALKMFIFGKCYMRPSFYGIHIDEADQDNYMHPFNCEARAYARLQEVGKEHLVIPCHGYIMLEEEQQAILREKDTFDWERDWGDWLRCRGQPLQALVKTYIEYPTVDEFDVLPDANLRRITRAIDSPKTARRLIRAIKELHRCGILNGDLNNSNIAKGLFLDFSTAWTVPHPCLDTKTIEASRDKFPLLGDIDAAAKATVSY